VASLWEKRASRLLIINGQGKMPGRRRDKMSILRTSVASHSVAEFFSIT
jgi:hypothetical protein